MIETGKLEKNEGGYFVKRRDFNKSELKTGMFVELRNGGIYMIAMDLYGVHPERNMIKIAGGFMSLSDYTDDLKYKKYSWDEQWDIIRVYSMVNFKIGDIFVEFSEKDLILLWDEEWRTPKELTISEIEDMLGYPVNIINENHD